MLALENPECPMLEFCQKQKWLGEVDPEGSLAGEPGNSQHCKLTSCVCIGDCGRTRLSSGLVYISLVELSLSFESVESNDS